MPNYRRYRVPGGSYFFTVNLLEGHPNDLLIRHIDVLRDSIRRVKQARPFHIDAWVILPDHLHCVWTLPVGDADYATRWRLIKTHFSRHMPKTERRSKVRQGKGERGIWQRRYWEHAIQDEKDYAAHIDYIHFNPVKHGHARQVADWPYSTFHRFVERGMYTLDWAADADNIPIAGEGGE